MRACFARGWGGGGAIGHEGGGGGGGGGGVGGRAPDTRASACRYNFDAGAVARLSAKDVLIVFDPTVVVVALRSGGAGDAAAPPPYRTLQVDRPSNFIVNGRSLRGSMLHPIITLANFDA